VKNEQEKSQRLAEDLLINEASSDFQLPDSDASDSVSKFVTSTDCNVQLKLLLQPSGMFTLRRMVAGDRRFGDNLWVVS